MPISLGWPVSTREAAALVAWANAFLIGCVSLDDAADGVSAGHRSLRVHGLPDDDAQAPAVALGRLSGMGARGLRLLLPVTGDPMGLAPEDAWLDRAGVPLPVAVLVGVPGYLVPIDAGPEAPLMRGWSYHPEPIALLSLPSLREAERTLGADLRQAIDQLTALDIAGHTQATLARIHHHEPPTRLPSGYPARAQSVLDRAWSVRWSIGLAAQDSGSAVSASQLATRQTYLHDLERSSRYAVVAAYNSPVEDLSG